MAVGKNGLITALDIGSTKVCCFIARPDGVGGMRVIGIGHQIARGMRAGAVVDMDAAEEAVRGAVDAAERMAKERVDSVLLSFSGGRPASRGCAGRASWPALRSSLRGARQCRPRGARASRRCPRTPTGSSR